MMTRGLCRYRSIFVAVLRPRRSATKKKTAPNLNLGDAVVTGFSGTLGNAEKRRAAGKSAIDHTFIDPDGARRASSISASRAMSGTAACSQAPKPFDVLAKDVGQVFGVALDDATPPNIYLAATRCSASTSSTAARDGRPERMKKGGPGAGWMKGSSGSNCRADRAPSTRWTAAPAWLRCLPMSRSMACPTGPGLGNLAYDAEHKQLFVSDLYTGMIHRFALDGRELGPPYDHGVTGRDRGQRFRRRPSIPRTASISRAPISTPKTRTPGTLRRPARRVWGLAVHDGRLYYSARNGAPRGPQIWSVGIEQRRQLRRRSALGARRAGTAGTAMRFPISPSRKMAR